jgi:chloramphenicol 3-O-phosphotransferase
MLQNARDLHNDGEHDVTDDAANATVLQTARELHNDGGCDMM